MGDTRSHHATSDQYSACFSMPDLATENFSLPNGELFSIDNENETAVMLSVKFADMDVFVSKKIYPGPNAILLKEVEANAILTAPEIANLRPAY